MPVLLFLGLVAGASGSLLSPMVGSMELMDLPFHAVSVLYGVPWELWDAHGIFGHVVMWASAKLSAVGSPGVPRGGVFRMCMRYRTKGCSCVSSLPWLGRRCRCHVLHRPPPWRRPRLWRVRALQQFPIRRS